MWSLITAQFQFSRWRMLCILGPKWMTLHFPILSPLLLSFSISMFFFKFHLEMGAKQLQTSVLDVLNYVSACNVFVMNIVFFF